MDDLSVFPFEYLGAFRLLILFRLMLQALIILEFTDGRAPAGGKGRPWVVVYNRPFRIRRMLLGF